MASAKADWIRVFGRMIDLNAEMKQLVRQVGQDNNVKAVLSKLDEVDNDLMRLFDEKVEEWENFERTTGAVLDNLDQG